jgi:hypothetical protein
MATIQLGTSKVGSQLMNYCEKKAEVKKGYNCDHEYAKSQFKVTRELYGKNNGIQAHHVIQSFKPGEIDPRQANEIGLELANKIAKGHEVMVYTHTDREHIHNHLVVNSVNFEDGHKYQMHGVKAIENVRDMSDKLCLEHGLSIVKEKNAELRYTLAEKHLIEKGQRSWKDEIRKSVDYARDNASNYNEFKEILKNEFEIGLREGKFLTYTHPDNNKWRVRGHRLGNLYERSTLENGFSRQIEREKEQSRTYGTDERNKDIKQINGKLYKGSNERRYSKENELRKGTDRHQKRIDGNSKQNDFDIEKAREFVESEQQSTAKDFGKWSDKLEREHEQGLDGNAIDRERTLERIREIERAKQEALEISRARNIGPSL